MPGGPSNSTSAADLANRVVSVIVRSPTSSTPVKVSTHRRPVLAGADVSCLHGRRYQAFEHLGRTAVVDAGLGQSQTFD